MMMREILRNQERVYFVYTTTTNLFDKLKGEFNCSPFFALIIKEVQTYRVCSEKIIFVTSNYLDKSNLKIFIAMDIIKRTVTANSNKLITTNGEAAPSLISSAWNLSDINEDIVLTDQNGQEVPFIIVPLSEGTIKVILTGGMEYTISEAEVSANIGTPLMYMVQKILKDGTTATSLSIGI
jgi:hypothetical protein